MMFRFIPLLLCLPTLASAQTDAGETLPRTGDLFSLSYLGQVALSLALVIALFTVASRLLTTFTPLYMMRQGLRASLLPALNLAQISEFSLVVIQTGAAAGHLKTGTSSAASRR